jgi:hypothetical protein
VLLVPVVVPVLEVVCERLCPGALCERPCVPGALANAADATPRVIAAVAAVSLAGILMFVASNPLRCGIRFLSAPIDS